MDVARDDTVNVTLRRRIAAYSAPTADELAEEIRVLEERMADEGRAWAAFERQISELEVRHGTAAKAAGRAAATAGARPV